MQQASSSRQGLYARSCSRTPQYFISIARGAITSLKAFCTSEQTLSLVVLLCALFGRAFTLEYTNLIEPTESRYASIAQEMTLSGDWVTPRLPEGQGMTPYLGKPPLHFWLTGISYSIFGVDEWSSRVPSFLAALLTMWAIYRFARERLPAGIGIGAALIAISSVLFFFLAGASVTDVTLCALVSLGTLALYRFARDFATRDALFAAAWAGMAFLCKGPVAIVLIAFPVCLWSLAQRDWKWLLRLPWVACAAVFIVCTAPWFVLCELKNPGFLRYFFWNENIARYLFAEYGDRYGSGHRYPHGMAWVMLFISFCPWSIVLGYLGWRGGLRKSWAWIRADSARLFVLCWAASAVLFFTFVRQLHAMYLLPSIPPLALLTACFFLREDAPLHQRAIVGAGLRKVLAGLLLLFSMTAFAIGQSLEFSWESALWCILLLAVISRAALALTRSCSRQYTLALSALLLVGNFVMVICAFSPHLNLQRSSSELLQTVAALPAPAGRLHRVGILSSSATSAHWTAKAWKTELAQQLELHFVEPDSIPEDALDFLLVRERSVEELSVRQLAGFSVLQQSNKWILLQRTSPVGPKIGIP